MRNATILFLFLFSTSGHAQCPTDISLTVKPDNCLGTALIVDSLSGTNYNQITWFNGTTAVNVVNATTGSGLGITVAGGNGNGAAPNQLYHSGGLYVDDIGNVYVVDVDNARVQKWAPGATSGVTVAGGNGTGSAANQLNYPIGLAVDGNGNLYIADASNNRIQKWTPGAASGTTVAGGNGAGSLANQLNDPTRIVIDKFGNLYIGDNNNNRVQKWSSGATSGITVAGGNGQGGAANQLYGIYGLALDNTGDIFISDNGNNRIQEWPPGGTSGITVVGGTVFGNAANQLGSPAGLFIDKNNNLYAGDYYNERVMLYAPGESTGILVAGGNGQGNAANQFFEPDCPFVDNNGSLYVSDAFNSRVQKWTSSSKINRSYTPETPGTYTAVVEIGNGCTVQSSAQIINPSITPTIVISTPNTQINACSIVSFTATINNGGNQPSYQWQINGNDIGTNTDVFTSDQIMDGDQINCILTSNSACALSEPVTSNYLNITINSGTFPKVKIINTSDVSCSGLPIHYIAELTQEAIANSYQWKINDRDMGNNSSAFTDFTPNNGDKISCEVDLKNTCVQKISDSTVISVYSAPIIDEDQIFYTAIGIGTVLTPSITGNIQSYAWSPGNTLSDSSIRNPVANPYHDTNYDLKVISVNGCAAEGKISVTVSSPIKIPNAFSPNNDGINDVFEVGGGPSGSKIDRFIIYDRWGAIVFTVENKILHDYNGGWNGYFNGVAAPEGAYVFFLKMSLPDGTKQVYKGSLLLIK